MKKYKKPKWAVSQTVRESGLVEDICEHGVGHPNRQWLDHHPKSGLSIHGCDGCCRITDKELLERAVKALKLLIPFALNSDSEPVMCSETVKFARSVIEESKR